MITPRVAASRSNLVVNVFAVVIALALACACSRPSSRGAEQVKEALSASVDAGEPAEDASQVAPRSREARAFDPVTAGGRVCDGGDGGQAHTVRCLAFPNVEAAFGWVLAHAPRVLAVGEAHAPRGLERVPSATKRFTETLLPMLRGRASDLIVEAWAPDPRCERDVARVAQNQAPVKQGQAASNPNEYLVLGTKAKALGVTPWLLRPSCEDFAALTDAGADAIPASLALIERLTERDVRRALARNASGSSDAIVVTYGGAMHNDLAPSEPFGALGNVSFGPALNEATRGRYVELDLIVPEYVRDTSSWKALPFYAAYMAGRDDLTAHEVALYAHGDASFVLVFPRTPKLGLPPSPEAGAE